MRCAPGLPTATCTVRAAPTTGRAGGGTTGRLAAAAGLAMIGCFAAMTLARAGFSGTLPAAAGAGATLVAATGFTGGAFGAAETTVGAGFAGRTTAGPGAGAAFDLTLGADLATDGLTFAVATFDLGAAAGFATARVLGAVAPARVDLAVALLFGAVGFF